MPARAAAAPRRRPGGRPRRALGVALPQREVARIPLAAGVRVLGGLHVLDLLVGQGAVRRPGPHVEVDVAGAVRSDVRVAALDQLRDHLQHLRDVTGRPRLVRRRAAAEHVVRPVQLTLELVGVRPPRHVPLGRLGQDLVVDVGHVRDHGDLVTRALQPAPQYVEDDLLVDVPDMRGTLHRQPTVVDPDLARMDRHEIPHCCRCGVVQAKCHRSRVTGSGTPP
jgi:hypothetical protein